MDAADVCVVSGYGQELARIGAELQPQSGNRDSAHLSTLATGVPHQRRNFRATWTCKRCAPAGIRAARKANRRTVLASGCRGASSRLKCSLRASPPCSFLR